MEKFAKLLQVQQGQILLTVDDVEDGNGTHELHIRMQQNGVTVTQKLSFPSRAIAIEQMERFDELIGQTFYNDCFWMFT